MADDLQEAKSAAVKYLERCDHSRLQVRDYLERKSFSAAVINRTLAWLEEKRYLDDSRFAQTWGGARVLLRKIGKDRLRQELLAKGVEPEHVETALDGIYAGVDEPHLAAACARKKLAGLKKLDPRAKRRRLARFLERQGFQADTVEKVLEQLALGE